MVVRHCLKSTSTLITSNAVCCMLLHPGNSQSTSFHVSGVSKKAAIHLISHINDCTTVTDFGTGNLVMALIFFGSALKPFVDMI